PDGTFYGTADRGGTNNLGTVFKIDAFGTVTTLHSFSGGADGQTPVASLVRATDGYYYGPTEGGGGGTCGCCGCGTIFRTDSSGNLTTLHSFSGPDGGWPSALIQGTDGYFYGTARYGGNNDTGVVFRMDSTGTVIVLHSFDFPDFLYPVTSLLKASDGNFYG